MATVNFRPRRSPLREVTVRQLRTCAERLGVARKSVSADNGGQQIVHFGARLAARAPRPPAVASGRRRDALADGDRASRGGC
jgi:hypothetical protein